MLISYNELNKIVDIKDLNYDQLNDIFNNHIIETENYFKLDVDGDLVVGEILKIEKFSDTKKLSFLKVDTKKEILDIVCGAPNIKIKDKVVVAKAGSKLKDVIIEERLIKDKKSSGMVCSLAEIINIEPQMIPSKFKDEVLILDNKYENGSDAKKILEINDCIYELAVTPNRNDLLSIYGIAKDLASILKREIKDIKNNDVVLEKNSEIKINNNINDNKLKYFLTIDNDYQSNIVEQINLIKLGWMPSYDINDKINMLTIFFGVPIFAYDQEKLNKEIEISTQTKEINFNKKEIKLENDIVLKNKDDIFSLSGIEIENKFKANKNSNKILLEINDLDNVHIRRRSIKLNLRNENSKRYEKKIPKGNFINLIIYLKNNFENIKLVYSNDKIDNNNENKWIEIDSKHVSNFLGFEIDQKEIKEILKDFNYNEKDNFFQAPLYRNDIIEKQDIYEEIIRKIGFNSIPEKKLNLEINAKNFEYEKEFNLRKKLFNLNIQEVKTYLLSNNSNNNIFNKKNNNLQIKNPISKEREFVIENNLINFLEVFNYNKKRQNENINIFEIKNFYKNINDYQKKLTILMSGNYEESPQENKSNQVDFYYLKNIVKELVQDDKIIFKKSKFKNAYNPYVSADIILENKMIGSFGKVSYKLTNDEVYFLEINFENIKNFENEKILNNQNNFTFRNYSKFPIIKRDISILVSKENPDMKKAEEIIYNNFKEFLDDFKIISIYEKNNYYSVTYRIKLSHPSRTLENKEINNMIDLCFNEILKNNYLIEGV